MERSSQFASKRFELGHVLEPDILTSFEYLKSHQRRDHFQPEVKLMFAILSDAIECFQKYMDAKNGRRRRLFAEAEAWILCAENRELFSFEQICQSLQLSPNYLRMGLLRWCAERTASKRGAKPIREPLRYQSRLRNTRISA